MEHILKFNKSILIDVNSDGLMDALCSNVSQSVNVLLTQDFKSANFFLINKGNMQFDILKPEQVNKWVDWLE